MTNERPSQAERIALSAIRRIKAIGAGPEQQAVSLHIAALLMLKAAAETTGGTPTPRAMGDLLSRTVQAMRLSLTWVEAVQALRAEHGRKEH